MFVDASAVVAILGREPGWEALFERLSASAGPLHFSALVRFEAAQAIARLTAGGQKPTAEHLAKARDKVDRFLAEIEAEPLAVGDDIGTHAIEASMRYGKAVGHPANLNFGDCFAYACAAALDAPLLYKGDDFARTDLA
jgi:ribonuclease VapC